MLILLWNWQDAVSNLTVTVDSHASEIENSFVAVAGDLE